MKKLFMALVAAASFAAVDAEVIKYDTPADWITTPKRELTVKDGALCVRGKTRLLSKAFWIQEGKEYVISAEIRQPSGLPRQVYVGFMPEDQKGIFVSSAKVGVKNGTQTVLTKDVAKGDKVLWIKANKKWDLKLKTVTANDAIVWNVKEDLSDLPNNNYLLAAISSVETAGGEMKVTLRKPFTVNLAAGSALRIHGDAGYMYTGGYGIPGRNDFKQFSGTVKGHSKSGFTFNQWPAGSKRGRVVLLINWNGKGSDVTEVRNVQLTVK